MLRSIRSRSELPGPGPGFTLVELIAAMTIMLLLTTIALPVAGVIVRRQKEAELKEDLRTMRNAIDRYKDFADSGMIPTEMDTYGYPPTLDTLVKGVPLKGSKDKYKFLRKIPVDPMTGTTDWGMRSMQDDPDSQSWGGQDVFDVFSKSQGVGMNGISYAEW
ncbi:MAG TPA: type II secretion system protein [Terriglobia bacterium]|nr:type II secretion system protein [Terriglobia bacterium]